MELHPKYDINQLDSWDHLYAFIYIYMDTPVICGYMWDIDHLLGSTPRFTVLRLTKDCYFRAAPCMAKCCTSRCTVPSFEGIFWKHHCCCLYHDHLYTICLDFFGVGVFHSVCGYDNFLLVRAKRREFSGMIPVITSNNPSNPQQPIQQPYVKRTRKYLCIYIYGYKPH